MRLLHYLVIAGILLETCHSVDDGNESDGDTSRKILGSSVVTSVSVVMDTGNKKNTIFTDAVGKPQSKPSNPSELASPIDLLNPDRYEFYTFDDNGDLVKRLMSLEEIRSIIARGDSDALDLDSFTGQGVLPERRVSDVVHNVQSVLKEEMEILKDPVSKPIFDTPDVSDSWSMILPAVFGNSGEDIKPERPIGYVTPDTIMLEPNYHITQSTPAAHKVVTTIRPTAAPTPISSSTPIQPVYYSSPFPTTKTASPTTQPSLNVEIISNGISTTDNNYVTKEPNSELESDQEKIIPTRAPIVTQKYPELIRNTTKITAPEATISTTNSSLTHSSTSNIRPSTQKTTTANQKVPVKTTSLKPTTIQWTSTSFRPTSTQLSSAGVKISTTPSSTTKVTTISPIPNIFGLPSFVVTDISERPSSTLKPTRSPSPNIFGFPVPTKQDSSPTTIKTIASTSPKPIRTSSITSTSQINVSPQLSTSSTVANQFSSSLVTRNPVFSSTSTRVTTENTIQKLDSSNLNASETLLKHNETKTSTWNDTQLFNIFQDVLSPSSTTENSRNSSSVTNADYLIPDSTNINDILSFESNKIQTTESIGDLSTIPTEKIQTYLATTLYANNEDSTTKLPSILNSLNDKQKLSASELLDQLLLTTNIYEINTELASSKFNASDVDERFDNADNNSTQPSSQDSEQQTTSTEYDIISYPPTTDITLLHSIEQLLSQAVGDVQAVLNQTTESTTRKSSPSDSLLDFRKETDVEASATSNTESEIISTTLNVPTDDVTTVSNNENLSSSVEALLSQVNDHTVPLNNILITEKPNIGVTYRRVEEGEETGSAKTTTPTSTTVLTSQSSLQLLNTTKSANEHKEDERETTTYYYIIKKDPTTEESTSQLVNVSSLGAAAAKNRTKPAKADLSLEQELIEEERKNMTLLQNGHINMTSETSEANATSLANEEIKTTTIINDIITTVNVDGDAVTFIRDQTTESDLTSTLFETEASNNDPLLPEKTTTEAATTKTTPIQSSTIQYSQINTVPKPSIVITINENNTIVTENGKLVANKTLSKPSSHTNVSAINVNTSNTFPPTKVQKNSTQDQTWTLVSTVAPQHTADQNVPPPTIPYPEVIEPPVPVDLIPKPMQGFGLEESTSTLDVDVHQFAQLCNELAFGFWKTVTTGLSSARSLFVSPFAATSMLAMVFLGAKGATSEEMNEILKLDDMVTFNPHLTFKSVSESVISEPNSGIATAAIIRELFSDRSKGKLLDFYKNRVRAFYDGFAEEVSYREIGDVIRRRTNLLVKKYTNGKYPQFLSDASITARSPLSGISINIFETDCSQTSSDGRDGELHFIVFPSMKQRRLVPVPAVVYKSGFLAGYEPSLDATAVAIGSKEQVVSTILVTPGQQGISAPGDGLARLEKRLVESSFKKGAWSRLLRSLIPRPGLEVQIPRFSHRSVINATNTLQRMGLHELFNPESADLRGLNGVPNELHLSDVLQINKFATCGEKGKEEVRHSEVYPATTMRARSARRLHHFKTMDQDEPRDYQRAFHDPLHDPLLLELPLALRPRQARIPEIPRLRFDRPFLYFVRHNPTGLILHMGRFNPRLSP